MSAARDGRPAPVIFTGPTITAVEAKARVPGATILPPVRRGDLYRHRNAGVDAFLIIDGSFSHGFAISPGEIVDVLRDGGRVYGCSSMGAIRGAECWPAGMVGIGSVYRLYRLGIVHSDDEVAVATNPDDDHAALSYALVNVRYALRRAVAAGALSSTDEREVLDRVMALTFAHRSRQRILACTSERLRSTVARWLDAVDIKRTDAHRALRAFAQVPTGTTCRRTSTALRPRTRYTGHQRLVGRSADELRLDLLRWLFGSGRYQRYVWPLVFDGMSRAHQVASSPDDLRALLAGTVGQAMAEPERLAARLFAELEYLDEVDTEILTMHAVDELSKRLVGQVAPEIERGVREETAVRHGAPNWPTLLSYVEDGMLLGAVPYEWIASACDKLARARSAAVGQCRPDDL